MRNRSAAAIITVLAVLFCACPGLALLCFGTTGFIDYYTLQSYIFGINNQNTANFWGFSGICLGILFLVVAVVIAILVLRKPREISQIPPDEPIPPAM